MFFNHQIALLKKNVSSKEVAFQMLADELLENNCVNQDFLANIIKREEIFPTGLEINGIGVAIPHTDSEYVKESQVGFMSLEEPLSFLEMGTNDKEVPVSLLFMLALKEPHEQLEMLQRLIEMFQQEGVLELLMKVDQKEAYQEIIQKYGLS
ncbi:PTS sugar transporter subunit IIA [Trichococcus collinsii]|uniref:PTS system IIA component, Gat family (TC 4.A.5) n=1 Tax=Trichococcus collinsii TaxID=157076 RepID=A0AB38A0W1_9LACT|nr:PTS sugar transporter subunit IIA [Trichococcus collinsii]CZQ91469.1 phosphotransferase/anion transporter [Trichococcus collinsii]SEA54977.1 PTS system IIA component, Gat family (TC 4.A.5) [Trichococcus collinsii]